MKNAGAPVMQLILPLAIAAAAIAVGSEILHRHAGLAGADNYLFFQLITGAHAASSNLNLWYSLALAYLFTVAASFAGYMLGPRASVAALLQLFVLAFLFQWLLWRWGANCLHPLALFMAMTIALLVAKAVRVALDRNSNVQTRNYELKLRSLELKKTRLQIVQQDEVERRLLAADLHDQVLNDLKMARQQLADFMKQPSLATATEIGNRISSAMEEIHEVMDRLSPSVLEHLGFTAAVDDLLQTACRASDMKKHFASKIALTDLVTLSNSRQALLYRLIQESLNNACKHSQGKSLSVTMDKEASNIVINIADDGKGIDLNICSNSHCRGIRYMRQRANLIGAKISWRHNDENGGGTIVEILLPVNS